MGFLHASLRLLQLAWPTLGFAAPPPASGPADVEPDPKVVEFINELFVKMKEAGADAADPNEAGITSKVETAGKIAQKFYHKSHHAKAGDNLLPDRLRFSFKKGFTGIKFYEHPVKVSRVRKLTTQAIGFKETAERGTAFDYFIDKKPGVSGRPAPIRIFIGEMSGITIDDLGSL
jgi:hypothetical protein